MRPRVNDTIIMLNEDGTETEALVTDLLSMQFTVVYPHPKPGYVDRLTFLFYKYEGIDWKHKS